ncbi:MAG: hypothetical protein AB7R00_25125 [Kofleriaceae bacterium]
MNDSMPRRARVPIAAMLALWFAVVAAPAVAVAKPFDPARLPAAAEGVGHFDVDASRKTQQIAALEVLANTNEAANRLPAEHRPLIQHLLTHTRSVSFWIDDDDRGAMIWETSEPGKLDVVLDGLGDQKPITVGTVKGRRFDKGDEQTFVARVGELFVLADDEASMAQTIDVLQSRSKSLAGHKSLTASRTPGVFFFAALDDQLLEKVSQSAQSATLKSELSSFAMTIAEVNAELRANATADVATEAGAQQIKSVVEGVRALAALSDDAKQFAPLLDKLQITVKGKRIDVAMAIPSRELIKLLKAAANP